MNHKVVIYAELNSGEDISEKELRLIINNLESRGFKGYYERVSANRIIQAFQFAKNFWDNLGAESQ